MRNTFGTIIAWHLVCIIGTLLATRTRAHIKELARTKSYNAYNKSILDNVIILFNTCHQQQRDIADHIKSLREEM